MKVKPVKQSSDVCYPEYGDYDPERRRLLRVLIAGGAAVGAGALLGCNQVREVLGVGPQPVQLDGEIACPTPPVPPPADDDDSSANPTGDDDSAGRHSAESAGDDDSADAQQARPVALPPGEPPAVAPEVSSEPHGGDPGKTRGRIRSPDAAAPKVTE